MGIFQAILSYLQNSKEFSYMSVIFEQNFKVFEMLNPVNKCFQFGIHNFKAKFYYL